MTTTRRRLFVMLMTNVSRSVLLVLIVCAGLAAAKGKSPAAVIGSLSIDTAFVQPTSPFPPQAGGNLTFRADLQSGPLPDPNGGDSSQLFVTLQCAVTGSGVLNQRSDGGSPDPVTEVPPTYQPTGFWFTFTLNTPEWQAAHLAAATCDAYLWWDGAHRPSRTSANTLSTLHFTVAAQ